MINKNKLGLALGLFFAIVHLAWSLSIAIIPQATQQFINWVFVLHSVVPFLVLSSVSLVNVILLLILTFIVGYIAGYLIAALFNKLNKK